MARAKTERLLNLVICLLATHRYLSKDEIRRAVPGYSTSQEAFERAFERDKEELRDMGIPVETGSNSAWFEDEVGYRIRREAYALPEVSLTGDEVAAVALAARAWQEATLAGAAGSALRKLKAYGVDPGELVPAGIEPRVDAVEASFPALYEAARDHVPVAFHYRRPGEKRSARRHVEPWGVVSWHGRWYLAGQDRDRRAPRVFRLSRIVGAVEPAGAAGEVQVPAGVDIRQLVVAALGERPATGTARLRARAGAAGFLRRQAVSIEAAAPAEGLGPEGWDVLEVPYADLAQLAESVAGLGAAVVVLDPPELREAVVARLRGALEAVRPLTAPAGEQP
ncbi:MAG: helix-turn-helix transcriptional regulator [Motilibacteraceae bacterium]